MTRIVLLLWLAMLSPLGATQEAWTARVTRAGEQLRDQRLGPARTLNDPHHPWKPPSSKSDWEQEQKHLRERILVSNGLWPLPKRSPLQAVVHSETDRGDYSVAKVYFQSTSGHYVSGNLYRPQPLGQSHPAVLSPHGHWRQGRFYDAGEREAEKQIATGAEQWPAAARHPLQARMVQLARMGCVVCHYDMVGYASSTLIPHREGFRDLQALLNLQNFMGLQTWNSLRALDFLRSLPEVDSERVGVTGGSGGGTQTMILGALDSRLQAIVPAVMVSTAMQGGCICENASYLRIGCSNIAFAALFAPRPQALIGADDWTIAIETKGYPELQSVYGLLDADDFILARAFAQFPHNYNRISRGVLYRWFNQHLRLGQDLPVRELDFRPLTRTDLEVFDEDHPLPPDALSAEDLRGLQLERWQQSWQGLVPGEIGQVEEYRRVVGAAARILLDRGVPSPSDIEQGPKKEAVVHGIRHRRTTLARRGTGECIPQVTLEKTAGCTRSLLWVDSRGKANLFAADGSPTVEVQQLLDAGFAVSGLDVYGTGEFKTGEQPFRQEVNKDYAGYTFCYNRPLLAERVHDVLTGIGALQLQFGDRPIDLLGTGDAGLWVLLAGALADGTVNRTAVDLQGFTFQNVKSLEDPNLLPGALRYGGVGGLAALVAPQELLLTGIENIPDTELEPLWRMVELTKGDLEIVDRPLYLHLLK
jgi:hypothetical protein